VTIRTLPTTLTGYLAPVVLAISLLALGTPCAAQEVDPPTVRVPGDARDSLVAPSTWLVVNTPVQQQVGLKLYGFYIGNLGVPVAQFDVPIRAGRFLTITPSYMYYSVPASGLNEIPQQPARFTDSYEEQQFRIDGTVGFAAGKLEISGRNMYVRRFRPDPAVDINRYRGRVAIAYPMAIKGRNFKPFASYETFYDQGPGWNRTRIWSGATVPVNKRLLLQPSYMWERSDGSRDVNYLLFGLIVNTR
jgi:Protein of unknown function (DUF2490)